MSELFIDRIDDDEYLFGETIDDKLYYKAKDSISKVSYKYIDLGSTEYNFCRPEFDNKDITRYFILMQEFTSNSFNTLYEERDREWHLHPNDYGKDKRFRELVNKAFGLDEDLKIECRPSFYHFALYTPKGGKSATTEGLKSPRIYFFVGSDGVIYPLFYDPYHEINPM